MQSNQFMCEVCFKTYKKEASLATHEKTHVYDKYNNLLVLSLVKKAIDILVSSGVHAADVVSDLD